MSQTSRTFEAEWSSECPECGEIIEPGDVIAYVHNHDDAPVCPECLAKDHEDTSYTNTRAADLTGLEFDA